MKFITVGALMDKLPKSTQDQIEKLLGPNALDHVPELRKLLVPHRHILKELGVLPEYAAYLLAYTYVSGLAEADLEIAVVCADPHQVLSHLTRN